MLNLTQDTIQAMIKTNIYDHPYALPIDKSQAESELISQGWTKINSEFDSKYTNNPHTGYRANVWQKDNVIIIENGCLELTDTNDIANGLDIAMGRLSNQTKSAENLYQSIKQNSQYNNCQITTTGYSLGGYLADYLGVANGISTISIAGPGMSEELIRSLSGPSSNNNILNLTFDDDPVGNYGNWGNIQYPGINIKFNGLLGIPFLPNLDLAIFDHWRIPMELEDILENHGLDYIFDPSKSSSSREYKAWQETMEQNNNAFNSQFNSAEAAIHIVPRSPFWDPIILDLDNDGIETTTRKNGVYFDHNTNGFAENSAWVGADDGLLVRDLNNNGTIDSGRELFGNNTMLANQILATSGYQALAELDTNSDGKIDINDTAFATLKILKGDGTLETLDEAGIKSVNLAYSTTNATDANGNVQVKSGSFTKTDNTTGSVGEFNFDINSTYSVATQWVEESTQIQALPDAQGFGNVYTLRQAMARDLSGDLQDLVESFVAETNTQARLALAEQILYKWTGTENVSTTGRGEFDGKKLAA